MTDKPDIIDAEFEVISGPAYKPRPLLFPRQFGLFQRFGALLTLVGLVIFGGWLTAEARLGTPGPIGIAKLLGRSWMAQDCLQNRRCPPPPGAERLEYGPWIVQDPSFPESYPFVTMRSDGDWELNAFNGGKMRWSYLTGKWTYYPAAYDRS